MVNRDRVFILGNGPSRLDFPLNLLTDQVTIGCNAIHRDWKPNFVVAIDSTVIEEIVHSASFYPNTRTRFIMPHWSMHHEYDFWAVGRKGHAIPPRNNVGMVAIRIAIEQFAFNELVLLGMDGFYSDLETTGNVYKGTVGYEGSTSANDLDVAARVEYMHFYLGDKYPHINFIFASDKGKKLRDGLGDYVNVINTDFPALRSMINAHI